MKIQLSQSEIGLQRRQTLSLADGAGVRIAAREGTVWVTQDHDLRDVILAPGEAIVFDRPGRVIVQALGPARVTLAQACRRRRAKPLLHRAASALAFLRRVRPPQLAWA